MYAIVMKAPARPHPPCGVQITVESVVHVVVKQFVPPNDTLWVTSIIAKFWPFSVKISPPDDAVLKKLFALMAGASNVKKSATVPTTANTATWGD